ncbi:MAG: hypothetical protein GW809_07375 [Bacteroidetes bacterium]|nr:hypothetical protein [Bacteroidota bacterium]
MNKELIKEELEDEINLIITSNSKTFKSTSGLQEKLEMWSTKLGGVEDFATTITKKLNEILEKHNVKFKNESEKNELITFLNPTIKELILKNIRK